MIVNEKETAPPGFFRLGRTLTGLDAPLAKQGFNSVKFYLCFSREGNQPPITKIMVEKPKKVRGDEKAGWTEVVVRGNASLTRKIYYQTEINAPPIADLALLAQTDANSNNNSKKQKSESSQTQFEKLPPQFERLQKSIHGIYICVKYCPFNALGLHYQTCVVDRYPFDDRKDSAPLPDAVATFCQPQGAKITTTYSIPTFLTFVLTNIDGMYLSFFCVCDCVAVSVLFRFVMCVCVCVFLFEFFVSLCIFSGAFVCVCVCDTKTR